jgi:hypothetical protein
MTTAELVLTDDFLGEFFPPISTDAVDGMVARYNQDVQRIDKVVEVMSGDLSSVLTYFMNGNRDRDSYGFPAGLFTKNGAINALNSSYWSQALALTDVLDCMPQARRDEWNKSIREMTTPDFEELTVRDTITSLLLMRSQFFAERVDGIFRNLSGEHVTNSPAAFGKRMILNRVLDEYAFHNYSKVGYINDLRAVIVKFMGRDELKWNATDQVIYKAKSQYGQWVTIDGGALKIRVYKKGTAHLEVHPDMAWRLNSVLASIYPLAIPAQFRTKPPKVSKEFTMMRRPLPFSVLEILSRGKYLHATDRQAAVNPSRVNTFILYNSDNKRALDEAISVLEGIGGVRQKYALDIKFDYAAGSVITEIITSGCVPDQKSHQFYPTPLSVATKAIELANIQEGDECLEPSAGQGGLADLMPQSTLCVEVSPLHCEILKAKNYSCIEQDFIAYAKESNRQFDKIVMNPPFSEGRAVEHVTAAFRLLKKGGTLVAVLPASFTNKDFGWEECAITWSDTIDNAFVGTSISVRLLKVVKYPIS